jgi:uncharacterized protein YbcV (DUF1398 family)
MKYADGCFIYVITVNTSLNISNESRVSCLNVPLLCTVSAKRKHNRQIIKHVLCEWVQGLEKVEDRL